MDRIISFDDFKKKSSELAEEVEQTTHEGHQEGEKQHYMFFQNLASIKHYVDEILTMDPEKVDAMLQDGHDWASDHIATSKDDIQEVAEWLRNSAGEEHQAAPAEEPEQMIVNVEGSNDEVEVEGNGGKEEEEDEDEEE
jgi:hypothetical protein